MVSPKLILNMILKKNANEALREPLLLKKLAEEHISSPEEHYKILKSNGLDDEGYLNFSNNLRGVNKSYQDYQNDLIDENLFNDQLSDQHLGLMNSLKKKIDALKLKKDYESIYDDASYGLRQYDDEGFQLDPEDADMSELENISSRISDNPSLKDLMIAINKLNHGGGWEISSDLFDPKRLKKLEGK